MYAMYCKGTKGLNKTQKECLGYYNYLVKQLDRYEGSVFYIPNGSRAKEMEKQIKKSVIKCKELNCGQYC